MSNTQRVALITGANRGMGYAVARDLAVRGYRVVLAARDESRASQPAATLRAEGLSVLPIALDVRDAQASREVASAVKQQFGRLDVLVNNAGAFFEPTDQAAGLALRMAEVSDETLTASLETNTFGAIWTTQALLPLMQANGYGRIVNVSSTMGSLTNMQPGWPAYRLSKAALNAVTRLFAVELAGSNIKINSVCPGWVRTDMGGPFAAKSVEEGIDTTLWLATLPDDGPSGGFFQDRKPVAW